MGDWVQEERGREGIDLFRLGYTEDDRRGAKTALVDVVCEQPRGL